MDRLRRSIIGIEIKDKIEKIKLSLEIFGAFSLVFLFQKIRLIKTIVDSYNRKPILQKLTCLFIFIKTYPMRYSILIMLLSILLFACNKNDNPATTLSSQKTVSSFIFKASDNPSLPADISANIGTDSILFKFHNSISRISLVPTITISGKTISPANHTAQNFSNSITYKVTAEDGTMKNYAVTVIQTDSSGLLQGYWHVSRDSVWDTPFFGLYSGGHPTPGVYIGTSIDFWNFASNGQVTLHENNQDYTVSYVLLPNNKLSFPNVLDVDFGPAPIEILTSNTLILSWSQTNPNGERYFRRLWLYK
jgi:hypothetical protein